ncbi:hypothetical protein B0H13DRAFT_1865179 [Mycena leptocephala]|nr:hypothetical protein B0H13DRAFT_1914679 [Mycena leptocephala]KAJ7923229.1 hypothetical protein B0H13DRAFT_1865179 [Mycena leptocephala]
MAMRRLTWQGAAGFDAPKSKAQVRYSLPAGRQDGRFLGRKDLTANGRKSGRKRVIGHLTAGRKSGLKRSDIRVIASLDYPKGGRRSRGLRFLPFYPIILSVLFSFPGLRCNPRASAGSVKPLKLTKTLD